MTNVALENSGASIKDYSKRDQNRPDSDQKGHPKNLINGNLTQTDTNEVYLIEDGNTEGYIVVDLGSVKDISSIRSYARATSTYRMQGLIVKLYDSIENLNNDNPIWRSGTDSQNGGLTKEQAKEALHEWVFNNANRDSSFLQM